LNAVWVESLFDIDQDVVQETDWFDDEIIATKRGDFFDKRQINYNKKNRSITANDLF
jgi:ribonucleoside-diphosphate reductase beta chain